MFQDVIALATCLVPLLRCSRPVSILGASTIGDALKVFRRLVPAMDRNQHDFSFREHAVAAAAADRQWLDLVRSAFLSHFGRPYSLIDYRISGVARDEFDDHTKDQLRRLSRLASAHRTIAVLHCMSSGRRHRTAVDAVRSVADASAS